MTNYTAIRTCAAIGENLAASLPIVDGRVRMPDLSSQDVELYVGLGADWDQRRAFEWGLLGYIAYRDGDEATAIYCGTRVAEIAARCGY